MAVPDVGVDEEEGEGTALPPLVAFSVRRYDLLKLRPNYDESSPKEAKGAIAFRCAYSLENRIVDDYGQRLRVAWALDGPRGGVECDEHGAPIISPADEDTDHPNFERIRFYPPGLGFKGYEFIEKLQPEPPVVLERKKGGWYSSHVHTAHPVECSVNGDLGFTFLVE